MAAGPELTRQGGYAQEFFVVVSGTADVFRDDERVGALEPGDFFGEVGLLAAHALGAHRDGRRDVAHAPARARQAPVPRAHVRRTHGRRADPPAPRAARIAPPSPASPPFPGRRHARGPVLHHSRKETRRVPGPRPHPQRRRHRSRCTERSTRSRPTRRSAASSSASSNRWIDGAHNRSTIKGFYGAGQEDSSRAQAFTLDAGEPAVLLGVDTGPNPAEGLLHALAACLTTTLVYVAAARKVRLTEVESTLEGDMDVRGALGLSDEVRNGFTRIQVSFKVKGDAPAEKLREVVERAQARSAVFDMVSHGVPVEVGVVTELSAAWRPGHVPRPPASTGEPRCSSSPPRPRPAPAWCASPSRSPRSSRRAPPLHDREASFPHASVDALKRAGYFARSDPRRARRPRRHLRARRRRRLEPPRPRRRVGRHRREHAPGHPDEHRAALADRRRRRRRAAGRDLRRVDGRDRPRRRGHRRRHQRAGPGPHPPAHHRDAHRRRAGASTGASRSARCRRPRPCSTPRSPSSTTTASSATATRRSRPTPPASRSTATGTRSACAPRAAIP